MSSNQTRLDEHLDALRERAAAARYRQKKPKEPEKKEEEEIEFLQEERPPFAQVPHSLITHTALGHGAVRLGAWLAGNQQGFRVRKDLAKRLLGLGEDAWRRATRELRAVGFLQTRPRRDPLTGHLRGQTYVFFFTPRLAKPDTER